jgi:hypothetical protein
MQTSVGSAAPAPVHVYIQSHYNARRLKVLIGLGFAQIFTGCLLIILNRVQTAMVFVDDVTLICCSVLFMIAGCFGVYAGTYGSRCSIYSYMVFSIIAAIACTPLFQIASTLKYVNSALLILLIAEAIFSTVSCAFCCKYASVSSIHVQ